MATAQQASRAATVDRLAKELAAARRKDRQNRKHAERLEAYNAKMREPAQNVPMKTVKNLMSGKEIQIPVNTPLSCDPSSETYWCM